MGKKNPEVMAKQRGKFVDGAKKNGIPEKKAGPIFDLMEHFAGYGFTRRTRRPTRCSRTRPRT